MKLDQSHISHIRTAFTKMQTKEDLLRLLNEVKPLIYGAKAIAFSIKQLTWYSNPKWSKNSYAEFKIKKKSGANRSIYAPNKGLKSIQKTLNIILQCVFEPHHAAMGFVCDKSIVDNARLHEGSRYVYNLDLKDFFSSIDQARVWKCLQLKPFNLNQEFSIIPPYMSWEDFEKKLPESLEKYPIVTDNLNVFFDTPQGHLYIAHNYDSKKDSYVLFRKNTSKNNINQKNKNLLLVNQIPSRLHLANIIAAVCCTEMNVERKNEFGEWETVKRNVLPQGAPTSPTITNIICKRLDQLLSGVAKRFGLKYSRYADDITFSSMHNVYQTESEFLKELHRIITEQGFHIKESKTRLQKDGHKKEVTGLLVNEKANVPKRYIKQLRMWLYYWERYGYERAYVFFLQQYTTDKGHTHKGKPDMINVIGGKLDYLKMVRGGDCELYLKLKGRFDILVGNDKKKVNEENFTPLEDLVSQINAFEHVSNTEVDSKNLAELLRISINVDSTAGRLKKNIIYKKGTLLPINIVEYNIDHVSKTIHRPKETNLFLSLFNYSEGLKYLTHKFRDEKPTYREFIELCRDEFEKGKINYPNVPNDLLRRIEEFSFSKNPEWFIRKGNEKIYPKKGWSEPSFIEWYNKKINIHPGYDSKWNKEMIIPFKESIEVRAGNLQNIIEEALITSLGDSKNNFVIIQNELNINTAEFYTDVDKLKLALHHIFSTIKDRSDKNFCFEIHIDYINGLLAGGNYKMLVITHINSEPTKKSNDKDFMKGDLRTIQSNLWSLCNYEIQGKFPDGYKSITILTDDEKLNQVIEVDSEVINGFTHILKFY